MPYRRISLSIRALLGNLEGVHLLGLLREKKSISGFPWNRGHYEFRSWDHLEILVKEQGSPELI
jgi:hypothetical protein